VDPCRASGPGWPSGTRLAARTVRSVASDSRSTPRSPPGTSRIRSTRAGVKPWNWHVSAAPNTGRPSSCEPTHSEGTKTRPRHRRDLRERSVRLGIVVREDERAHTLPRKLAGQRHPGSRSGCSAGCCFLPRYERRLPEPKALDDRSGVLRDAARGNAPWTLKGAGEPVARCTVERLDAHARASSAVALALAPSCRDIGAARPCGPGRPR
jgi:hypothetical protein